MEKSITIYKISCDVPSMHVVYVGKTSQSLSGRLSHHAAMQQRPSKLNQAISSLGKEHFSIEAIEVLADYKQASNRERYWIEQLGTAVNGYNIRLGAAPTSEEIAAARVSNYRNRAVVCYTNGKTYRSCSEAARALGLNTTDVSECCAMHLRQTSGYQFGYADCDVSLYQAYWSTVIARNRKVRCLESGIIYRNVKAASDALGIHHASLARALTKTGYVRKLGLHFVFVD